MEGARIFNIVFNIFIIIIVAVDLGDSELLLLFSFKQFLFIIFDLLIVKFNILDDKLFGYNVQRMIFFK